MELGRLLVNGRDKKKGKNRKNEKAEMPVCFNEILVNQIC